MSCTASGVPYRGSRIAMCFSLFWSQPACWRCYGSKLSTPKSFRQFQFDSRGLALAHLLGNLYHKRTTFERIGATVLKNIADHITVGIGVAILGFVAHVRAHRFST